MRPKKVKCFYNEHQRKKVSSAISGMQRGVITPGSGTKIYGARFYHRFDG